MKKSLTLMLFTVMSMLSFAQSKFNVSGTIIEKETHDVVAAATVRILSLPDSSMVGGAATSAQGTFTVNNIKKGKYVIKVTFIGYKDHVIPLDLTNKKQKAVNIGYITLVDDAKLLKETVVSANAAQVQVSGDSLVYNASAIRTSEGSQLEELVKKLPGAEIDDDGNITINGKKVSKILVDGKEFFLNDKNMALKNIPTKIIDKIKSYDRKSDLARVTGIDDGEEETVIDLEFKKGMNQGWFGNVDASYGTAKRNSEKLMLNRFIDHNQFTIVGSINNVGDRGFGGGGGRGGWGRGGNGDNTVANTGFNFATVSDKLETGGNVRFNWNSTDVWNRTNSQNFTSKTGSFNNSINQNYSDSKSVNADFRLEWKPDSMTNIIFRPSGSMNWNKGRSWSKSATFTDNEAENNDNVLEWAENNVLTMDSIYNTIVNTNSSFGQTFSSSKNFNGELQINRKFNNEGRNLTLRVTGGASGSESQQLSASSIKTRKGDKQETNNNRYYNTPGRSHNINTQLTYSEPIAEKTYLQFSYRFQYSYSSNDRQASIFEPGAYTDLAEGISLNKYDINGALDYIMSKGYKFWGAGTAYEDSLRAEGKDLNRYTEYRNYNQTATIQFRRVRDNYNLSVGLDFLPQHSKLDYKYRDIDTVTTRTVFNFSPNLDFRYNWNKQTQLRATYRGRTSQPSMTDLLPTYDDSNPLNIRMGNPGLKPSFNHNMRLNFNTYNADLQQGIFTWANANFTQNSISNKTWYNDVTGVRKTQPMNINGNWNGDLGFGYNRGLGANKYFTVNTFTRLSYNHQVSYVDESIYQEEKSATNRIDVNERLSGGFRKDWFEISLNGNLGYAHSRNNVVSTANLDTWNFSYGSEINLNFDFGLSFNTDISMSSRRGYSQASMNTNELIWNAKISQSFLKGRPLVISFEWNDILAQRSNISRSITAMSSSDSEYNSVFSYGMIHIIYKLNIFGGKSSMSGGERGPWGGGGFPGGGRPNFPGGGRGPR